MVIGLLAVTAIPTVTGVGNAVSAQKRENAASKEQEKFHLTAVYGDEEDKESPHCVLKDKRLVTDLDGHVQVPGYQFCGYYFTYPNEEKQLGLVSTISDDPPMLNWIFVNKDTHALEFGSRKETLGHVVGPWGWTDDEAFLTLQGSSDSFVGRWEDDADGQGGGSWAVYWDPEGEMLGALSEEECVEIRLRRRPLFGLESRYVRH
ncbi:hypothetical protein ESCO_004552 [Escovopsis weberi]|uniref:Uncharacterized protein n=1 Tax=Escovopsis weberi TaxID=150374 RepID=A0A0N0RTV0_ESCWE|nr:hypothetical protein ESCO_004552 [Escovopsis weberi]